jgi:excisionase family DNA binding protein
MTEKLLSREEVAELFGLTISTIRRWERAGKLHPLRLGPITVRFRPEDVEAFLQKAAQ